MSGVRIVVAPREVAGWSRGLRQVATGLRDAAGALGPVGGLDLPPEAQAALAGIPGFAGPLQAESYGLAGAALAAGRLAAGAERADAGTGKPVTIIVTGVKVTNGVVNSLADGKLFVNGKLVRGEAASVLLAAAASITGQPVVRMLDQVNAWRKAIQGVVIGRGPASSASELLAAAALSRGDAAGVRVGRSLLGIAPGTAGRVGRVASRLDLPLAAAADALGLATNVPGVLSHPTPDNALGTASSIGHTIGDLGAAASAIPVVDLGPSETVMVVGHGVGFLADGAAALYDVAFKPSPPRPQPLTLADRLAAAEAGRPYSTWAANGPLGTTPWALNHPFER